MQTLDPGTPFGAYTIEGLIAGGGMGSVYAARHTVYGTTCALKVLHPKLHRDDAWRKRFEAEGFAGTTLKHPHVLAAREVILEQDDQIGLVLDLVKEGLTLHRVMSREFPTGVPLVAALRVFLGLVQGIEYAHNKEIVHGDIKPENVLIQGEFRDPSSWVPMVTDFGTVGILAHPVVIDGMPAVVVSPRYASPEHLKGMVHLEPRSDIYCLGLLLHYIVTGRHCSVAKSVEQAAERVAEPTSTAALVDQPEALTRVFLKATERDIDARYPSARELALAVRDLLDQLGEGLELDDLQADLATEIMEEQHDMARQKRIEGQRAAAEAAQPIVSEVATPIGDLVAPDLEQSVAAPQPSAPATPDEPSSDEPAPPPADDEPGVDAVATDDSALDDAITEDSVVTPVPPSQDSASADESIVDDPTEPSGVEVPAVHSEPSEDAPSAASTLHTHVPGLVVVSPAESTEDAPSRQDSALPAAEPAVSDSGSRLPIAVIVAVVVVAVVIAAVVLFNG